MIWKRPVTERVHNVLLLRAVRWPLVWIFSVLLVVPFIGALVKGTLTNPAHWPVLVSLIGGVLCIIGILLTRFQLTVMLCGLAMNTTIVLLWGTAAYEPGLFIVGTALCAFIMISGRPRWGLSVGVLRLACLAAMSLRIGGGAEFSVLIDWYSLTFFALAYVWLRFIKTRVRNEHEFRQRGRVAIARRRSRERELARMRLNNALSSTGALHALNEIANAPDIDADARRAIRIAEANLRDHVRCPELSHPRLTAEILRARERDVDVLLIGTSNSNSHLDSTLISDELADALAGLLSTAQQAGRATVRVLPSDNSDAAVSVLISNPDQSANILELAADGTRIPTGEGRKSPPQTERLDPKARAVTD